MSALCLLTGMLWEGSKMSLPLCPAPLSLESPPCGFQDIHDQPPEVPALRGKRRARTQQPPPSGPQGRQLGCLDAGFPTGSVRLLWPQMSVLLLLFPVLGLRDLLKPHRYSRLDASGWCSCRRLRRCVRSPGHRSVSQRASGSGNRLTHGRNCCQAL